MSYNPYTRQSYNYPTSYGEGMNSNQMEQELANIEASVESEEPKDDAFEKYFPTIYKTLWGKDSEEMLSTKQAQLDYILLAISRFPASEAWLATKVNKLKSEIKTLKRKSLFINLAKAGAIGSGVLLTGSVSYALIKWASSLGD